MQKSLPPAEMRAADTSARTNAQHSALEKRFLESVSSGEGAAGLALGDGELHVVENIWICYHQLYQLSCIAMVQCSCCAAAARQRNLLERGELTTLRACAACKHTSMSESTADCERSCSTQRGSSKSGK